MSRYRRVWVVYRKELLDTLRDRRTLIAMVLVPIVLYPVLMVVLMQALKTETGRRQAERYQVCVPTAGHDAWLRAVLAREEIERQESEQAGGAEVGPDPEAGLRAVLRAGQLDIAVAGEGQSLWSLVAGSVHHAGLLVEPPPNPDRPDDEVNRIVQIIYRDTDPRSEFVHNQLSRILSNEADRIVRARVARMPGGVDTLAPLVSSSLSTATPAQQFAKILAMIVPFLLVVMTVTGAMYPAIDLTAGERERGTLETLAVAPVPVGQIVAGKFCVIVTIAMLSTALNLGSMSAMVHFSQLDRMVTRGAGPRAADSAAVERLIQQRVAITASAPAPAPGQADYLARRRQLEQQARQKAGLITRAAPIVLLAMVPFAVLSGAVMLATCSFARTFKEAQNYMMPVMMAAILPAMVVSYMPTVRLEGVILVIPVANIVALIRDLLLGQQDVPAMTLCLLSTSFYAAVAVMVAARLYGHEAVLFSDVGSYKTLLQRRFFRPQERPWPALALLSVAVIFPVYFYWQSYLADPRAGAGRIRLVLAASQVLILAAPPLLLSWYVRLDLRRTFSLAWPRPMTLLATALLAISVVPVGALANEAIRRLLPGLAAGPEETARLAELLTSGPLAGVLLAFAVLPGICEELLFRGFLLAGLRGRVRPLAAVVVVGVVFGLFHVIAEKIPITSLLGVLLAVLCLRGGSIVPCMLLHMANNGLALSAARIPALAAWLGLPSTGATGAAAEGMRFTPRVCAFAAVFVLGLVVLALDRPGRRAGAGGDG